MDILSQPLENLDLIVDCIDDPKDLTALALTCRRLADVLHPWYTEFRHIRCTYTSAFVWQALAASPALARRVRVLNICRSVGEATPPRIPEILCRSYAGSSYPVAEPDVAVASLRAALKEMWYLQSFHWHEERNSADASNGDAHEDGDIWSAVSDCKNLILLSVREYSSCFLRRCSVFANMLALRSFSYMTGAKSLQVDLRMLANMLQTQCPNLERIHMAFENDGSEMYDDENPAFEIGSTILAGRWRALRSVRFEFARCSVEQAIAFFEAHPTLTEVRVDYAFASDDQLWPQRLPCLPGLLPNLHGLECDAEQAADILSCPVDSTSSAVDKAHRVTVFVMNATLPLEARHRRPIVQCQPAITVLAASFGAVSRSELFAASLRALPLTSFGVSKREGEH